MVVFNCSGLNGVLFERNDGVLTIFSILNQQESGRSVRDICREHTIAEGTFYQWKNKYGGMVVSDVKQLKELEEEISDSSECSLI